MLLAVDEFALLIDRSIAQQSKERWL